MNQLNQRPTTVIKVGGNELDNPVFLDGLVAALSTQSGAIALVHGGGKEISAALERYGQTVTFVDGLRVTPPESMAIMEMVVCGQINKRLVGRLVGSGQQALGLSGVDLGLMRCTPLRPNGIDLGRVGQVTNVDILALQMLLTSSWLPVIAPVALGENDNLSYNVNADHVALAIAAALTTAAASVELVFVSNVPGVLLQGEVIPELDAAQIEQAIVDGVIYGGMIPKVRSALAALAQGVTAVRITDLKNWTAGGTRIAHRKMDSQ